MYSKILCPFNKSERSLKALRHTLKLAGFTHGEVFILHASMELLDEQEETMLRVSLNKFHQHENETIQDIQDYVVKVLNREDFQSLSKNIQHHLSIIPAHDDIGKAIVTFAADNEVDLIVMPKHDKSVAWEIIRGSISMNVVHHAHCPVLFIPDHC